MIDRFWGVDGVGNQGLVALVYLEQVSQFFVEAKVYRQRGPRHRQAHQHGGQGQGEASQAPPLWPGAAPALEVGPARLGVQGGGAGLLVQLVQQGLEAGFVWVLLGQQGFQGLDQGLLTARGGNGVDRFHGDTLLPVR